MREEQFQFILDHAVEMIMMFGEDGKITYANQSAMERLAYGAGLYEKKIADIFPAIFSTECEKDIRSLSVSENMDTMAYRKNQTCFPVWIQFLKVEDNPVAYMCMGYDATDRVFYEKKAEQAEQELKVAQKVKNEFVANVTHELRTPVNGILANARELQEKTQDTALLPKLKLIERGCNDMNALINNILDFSKLEAGKFTLEQRRFNFREMMGYVKSNHINKMTEKGLEFFMAIAPDIPEYIAGDELRIVQILNNLLSNACKFTSVGKISVEVVKTAELDNRIELFFLVMDTGIGMSNEDMDKLFKSFSQVDASISRRYGGTGLGLNISKQLVELMEGNIHVQSTVGQGTMFSFHIWVGLEEETLGVTEMPEGPQMAIQAVQRPNVTETDALRTYESAENRKELKKKMSKLILCLELENWEKAEMFMESVRQLTETAPREIKTAVLRLKMAVQKGDYEKSVAAYDTLQKEMEHGE